MARNDTIIRTLAVAKALASSRRGVALRTLADKHGFALRNLYRDLHTLTAAGFTILEEDGRYRIEGEGAGPNANRVDREELLALYAANKSVARCEALVHGARAICSRPAPTREIDRDDRRSGSFKPHHHVLPPPTRNHHLVGGEV